MSDELRSKTMRGLRQLAARDHFGSDDFTLLRQTAEGAQELIRALDAARADAERRRDAAEREAQVLRNWGVTVLEALDDVPSLLEMAASYVAGGPAPQWNVAVFEKMREKAKSIRALAPSSDTNTAAASPAEPADTARAGERTEAEVDAAVAEGLTTTAQEMERAVNQADRYLDLAAQQMKEGHYNIAAHAQQVALRAIVGSLRTQLVGWTGALAEVYGKGQTP